MNLNTFTDNDTKEFWNRILYMFFVNFSEHSLNFHDFKKRKENKLLCLENLSLAVFIWPDIRALVSICKLGQVLIGYHSENLNTRPVVRKQVDFLADKLIFQQLARVGMWEIIMLYYAKKCNLKILIAHLSTSLLDQQAHKSINCGNCASLKVKWFRQKSRQVIFDPGKLILLSLVRTGKWWLILKAYTVPWQ